jgi:PKD repeat protein
MRSKPPLSLTWKFGDPTSGSLNSATGDTASHVFSAPGTYTVLLIRQFNCYTDTVVQTIAINVFFPTLTFNPKKTICTGEKATLTITGAPSFSWSGPSTTASGTNAIVQPTTTTLYTVVATATNGCTKTNTLQVVINKCIGLNENSKAFVSIGPNPVTTDLELHAENCQLQSISIYSLDGRLVMTQALQNTNRITVQVTDLPNGLYTTSITTEAGVVRLKMIKQ